jgi:hypothetical protein
MRNVFESLVVVAGVIAVSGCGGGDDSSSLAVSDGGMPAAAEYDAGMASPSVMPAGEMPAMESPDDGTMPVEAAADAMMDGYPGAGGDTPTSTDPGSMYVEDSASAAAYPSDDSGYDPGSAMPATSDAIDPAGTDPVGADIYGGAADAYGAGGQTQEEPQDLLARAKQALREGRDHDAFQFYYSHALMNDHAANEILSEMKWFPLRKHPALVIRWGVGIHFSSGPGIQGNLFPIGTTQQFVAPTRGNRRGAVGGYEASMPNPGEAAGGMEAVSGGGGNQNAAITKMTGDFGQQVVDQFMSRMQKGDFGTFLKGADDKPRNAGGAGESGAMPGMGGMYGGGGGPQAAGDGTSQLTPGVTFLGTENEKKLLQKAEDLDIDVLVVFHVNVAKAPRTGYTTNTNKITLHDVRTGREVYKSSVLTNIAVQKARESDKDDDPVEKEVEKLFNFVDKTYQLITIPEGMKAEHAIGMVKELIGTSHDNPLPVLAEIKFFHTLGLLTDQHLESAYARVVDPPDATALASGDEEERRRALEAWLPR